METNGKKLDFDAVEAHLELITEHCEFTGNLEFRSIFDDDDGMKAVNRKFSFAGNVRDYPVDLRSWIKTEAERSNSRIFVGLCVRQIKRNRHYYDSSLFFIDLDGTGDTATVKDLENIISVCEDIGFDPLRVVHSGGGFHIYFRTTRAMTPDERRATVKNMTHEIARDRRTPGRADPAVCDAARVVGLWGTINGKRGTPVGVLYEGAGTPVPVSPPMSQIRKVITKLPEWKPGMNPKVFAMRLLLPVVNEFPSMTVLDKAADQLVNRLPTSGLPGLNEAYGQCRGVVERAKMPFPKVGGRRMWAYAKLASLVEAFPSLEVLKAAAEVIKSELPDWVNEEPYQVESIVDSLIKDRLC